MQWSAWSWSRGRGAAPQTRRTKSRCSFHTMSLRAATRVTRSLSGRKGPRVQRGLALLRSTKAWEASGTKVEQRLRSRPTPCWVTRARAHFLLITSHWSFGGVVNQRHYWRSFNELSPEDSRELLITTAVNDDVSLKRFLWSSLVTSFQNKTIFMELKVNKSVWSQFMK